MHRVLSRLLGGVAGRSRQAQQHTVAVLVQPYNAQHYASGLPGIRKLLVANRGEIACRVLATARRLGIPTVAVYSDADATSAFVAMADEALRIGPPPARDSYLRPDAVLAAAAATGATAIHPGYGFLSENAGFAEACAAAGVAFVGPPPGAIRSMGDKAEAKRVMGDAGVPVVPGYHGSEQGEARLLAEAAKVGFPLLVKAVSGGGGKGMKLATSQADLPAALASARREALASFNDDRLLLERYITRPRHVEVQLLADSHGNAVYVYDRDCSVQRRHQKIIEEAPAPGLPPEFHQHIGEAAVRAAHAVGYVNAGTVEFIVDVDSGEFFFMEMNTRLQVEHPVSEAVSGLDLVEMQLRVAAGEKLPITQADLLAQGPRGHSFEARLYAESPRRGFLPGAGRVRRWRTPPGATAFAFAPEAPVGAGAGVGARVRVDSGVREGDDVGIHYDPMIAKVVTTGSSREEALAALRAALAHTQVAGLPTNVAFLQRLAAHPAFEACELDTGFIPRYEAQLLAPRPVVPQVVALAAVARSRAQGTTLARSHAPQAAMGAWEIRDAKRLWLPYTKQLTMNYVEAEKQLQLQLTYLSDREYQVVVSPELPLVHVRNVRHDTSTGRLLAEVDGRRLAVDALVYGTAGEEVLVLWLEGESHEFRWTVPTWSKDADAAAVSSSGKVVSPMPGKVVKVLVREGQAVVAGQALLVMEAMKMEHSVVAPRAGVVRGVSELHVGAQVDDGQLLVCVLDESEGGKRAGAAA